MTLFLAILTIVAGAVLIWVGLSLKAEIRDHADTQRELVKAEAEVARLDREMSRLLLNLTPLIEQTDWMTGRWGGQFQTLVALENKRNTAVREVRKSLMDIPAVKHLVASGAPVLPTSIELNGSGQ